MNPRYAAIVVLLATAVPVWAGPSVYLTAPDDPKAVTVRAVGDGRADDGPAIQQALDAASHRGAGGIVYLPSGRYRITHTVYIWPGVRLLGVGPTRPVLMLGDATPGFQEGVKNMVIFAGRGPEPAPPAFARKPPFPPTGSVPFNEEIADANPGTFYSAMGNIDIEIGPGNRRRGGHSLPCRPARLSEAHGLRPRVGLRRRLHGRQRGGGPAFPRRALRHRHRKALAGVAVHADRQQSSTASATPRSASTKRASRWSTSRSAIRPSASRSIRGYGDWLCGQQVRFENVSQAGVVMSNERERLYPGRLRQRAGQRHSGVRAFPRQRQDGAAAAAPTRSASFTYGLTLPTRRRHGPTTRRASRPRRSRACPRRSDWHPRAAADRPVDQCQDARREGRRQERRYRRACRRPSTGIASSISRAASTRSYRHAHAEAGHGADRPASQHDADRRCPTRPPAFRASARPRRSSKRPEAATTSSSASGSSPAASIRAPPRSCGRRARSRSWTM